eukprot:CAMPEP_0180673058 /NCGR_PEP_ID=MMETSP1037_2-20121125/65486_1 /TAXON_ID=632150 /ORGANISM="Azadinium spinosum, Strain 3D9" /LENGTH=126 /DNA_ID=CAMNT_0022702289 /DNA_START=191 /DNA_END=571 /DNA_ORIENTATION=+
MLRQRAMLILSCLERLLDHGMVLADEGVQVLKICHPGRCPLRDLALDVALHALRQRGMLILPYLERRLDHRVLLADEGAHVLEICYPARSHASDIVLQGAHVAEESRRLIRRLARHFLHILYTLRQ